MTPQNAKKRKFSHGRGIRNPHVDEVVVDFVRSSRDSKKAVTAKHVAIALIKNLPEEFGGQSSSVVRQKAYRILARNGFSNRRVTNLETVLSEEEMGRIHLDYVAAFRKTIVELKCTPALIINMDETPIYFDPESKTTYDTKGKKKISVKKTTTTSKASALLAVSLSGEKLKPFVVFIAKALNGKVKQELDTYDKRAAYGVGPAGFSDTRIMVEWVNAVLKPISKSL